MTSADNLLKEFVPRSGLTTRKSWSGSKLFDRLMFFFSKRNVWTRLLWKENHQTPNSWKSPNMQKVQTKSRSWIIDDCYSLTEKRINVWFSGSPTCITLMLSPVSCANCSRIWRVGFGVALNAALRTSNCFALIVVLGPRRLLPAPVGLPLLSLPSSLSLRSPQEPLSLMSKLSSLPGVVLQLMFMLSGVGGVGGMLSPNILSIFMEIGLVITEFSSLIGEGQLLLSLPLWKLELFKWLSALMISFGLFNDVFNFSSLKVSLSLVSPSWLSIVLSKSMTSSSTSEPVKQTIVGQIKIPVFRVTRPYHNLLVKPRIFQVFWGKYIFMRVWNDQHSVWTIRSGLFETINTWCGQYDQGCLKRSTPGVDYTIRVVWNDQHLVWTIRSRLFETINTWCGLYDPSCLKRSALGVDCRSVSIRSLLITSNLNEIRFLGKMCGYP